MSEYSEWIDSRPLSWWREYMKGAMGIYTKLVNRPLTKTDKRDLFAQLKYHYVILGGVGSFTALAIMTNHHAKRAEVQP